VCFLLATVALNLMGEWMQAMGSFDQKCVRVLDFQTRESLQELVGHTGGVMSLRFDRNILLSTSRDRTVKSACQPPAPVS